VDIVAQLTAARANLWRAQERFGFFPDLTVSINGFAFPMDRMNGLPNRDANFIRCRMAQDVLQRLLNREAHYNNLELACLIEFDRRPNVYLPDFHTLMSFFHVPYPKEPPCA
jgi:hypothetical protein